MHVTDCEIAGLKIIEPVCFHDQRGCFFESFHAGRYRAQAGIDCAFVQDNHSRSTRGVLRGLHYQLTKPQGKLVRVAAGAVFDVTVDLRRRSPTFGQWFGIELSAENRLQLWIPTGFAHGLLVLSDSADLLYKTTEYYYPEDEHCLIWHDADVAIEWPLDGIEPNVSARDSLGKKLTESPSFP